MHPVQVHNLQVLAGPIAQLEAVEVEARVDMHQLSQVPADKGQGVHRSPPVPGAMASLQTAGTVCSFQQIVEGRPRVDILRNWAVLAAVSKVDIRQALLGEFP
jgi:hypothetical protein